MRLFSVTTLTLLLLSPSAWSTGKTPEDIREAFYAWVLAHPSAALPSAVERAQLVRILAPATIQLLERAAAMESLCVKSATADDKPFIVEGDLFVGNYEGASEVAYGDASRTVTSENAQVMFTSDLLYIDTRFAKAHRHRTVAWRDRLDVRLLNGHWQVHDVQFSENHSLRGNVQAYVEEATKLCAKP